MAEVHRKSGYSIATPRKIDTYRHVKIVKIKSDKNRSQTTFLFLLGHGYHHKRNNIPGEFHGNVQHPEFPPGMLLRVPTWAAPILSVAMRMQLCIGFGTPIVAGQTLRKGWYCWRNLKWRRTRGPQNHPSHCF